MIVIKKPPSPNNKYRAYSAARVIARADATVLAMHPISTSQFEYGSFFASSSVRKVPTK